MQQIKKSKMVVFLSTQDSVEFHHQLFTQVFNSSSSSAALLDNSLPQLVGHDTDQTVELDLFKLHGDMEQKVSNVWFVIYYKIMTVILSQQSQWQPTCFATTNIPTCIVFLNGAKIKQLLHLYFEKNDQVLFNCF